ncbi:SRPBCC family protein [Nocardia sp. NPDC058705]|uniref:SRPBCC family protein n=1 Tax=Nocardia sp. NPDC058705 TaxID=3346609 RepID=UPI0036C66FA9
MTQRTATHYPNQVRASGTVSLITAPESMWEILSRPAAMVSWMTELHTCTSQTSDQLNVGRALTAQLQLFNMLHEVELLVTEYRPTRSWTMTCDAGSGIVASFSVRLEQVRDYSKTTLHNSLSGPSLLGADFIVLHSAIQFALDLSLRRLVDIAHSAAADPMSDARAGEPTRC